jgi:hypothetical protein
LVGAPGIGVLVGELVAVFVGVLVDVLVGAPGIGVLVGVFVFAPEPVVGGVVLGVTTAETGTEN